MIFRWWLSHDIHIIWRFDGSRSLVLHDTKVGALGEGSFGQVLLVTDPAWDPKCLAILLFVRVGTLGNKSIALDHLGSYVFFCASDLLISRGYPALPSGTWYQSDPSMFHAHHDHDDDDDDEEEMRRRRRRRTTTTTTTMIQVLGVPKAFQPLTPHTASGRAGLCVDLKGGRIPGEDGGNPLSFSTWETVEGGLAWLHALPLASYGVREDFSPCALTINIVVHQVYPWDIRQRKSSTRARKLNSIEWDRMYLIRGCWSISPFQYITIYHTSSNFCGVTVQPWIASQQNQGSETGQPKAFGTGPLSTVTHCCGGWNEPRGAALEGVPFRVWMFQLLGLLHWAVVRFPWMKCSWGQECTPLWELRGNSVPFGIPFCAKLSTIDNVVETPCFPRFSLKFFPAVWIFAGFSFQKPPAAVCSSPASRLATLLMPRPGGGALWEGAGLLPRICQQFRGKPWKTQWFIRGSSSFSFLVQWPFGYPIFRHIHTAHTVQVDAFNFRWIKTLMVHGYVWDTLVLASILAGSCIYTYVHSAIRVLLSHPQRYFRPT